MKKKILAIMLLSCIALVTQALKGFKENQAVNTESTEDKITNDDSHNEITESAFKYNYVTNVLNTEKNDAHQKVWFELAQTNNHVRDSGTWGAWDFNVDERVNAFVYADCDVYDAIEVRKVEDILPQYFENGNKVFIRFREDWKPRFLEKTGNLDF